MNKQYLGWYNYEINHPQRTSNNPLWYGRIWLADRFSYTLSSARQYALQDAYNNGFNKVIKGIKIKLFK